MTPLMARLGAFSLALALAACGAPRPEPPDATAGKAFKVVTTFLPITLFTRAVAGDCATVT
ncbi:MAG: zinc transporter substrate-binding protein, partial [Cyanobacteria bacterium M_DeepCast_200m_mx_001]|nr:zinc transporter substrate-binding protein [Cyanobacteria bacterium M_DeepCast_200m_mx_001]